jgi:hypothetical protein
MGLFGGGDGGAGAAAAAAAAEEARKAALREKVNSLFGMPRKNVLKAGTGVWKTTPGATRPTLRTNRDGDPQGYVLPHAGETFVAPEYHKGDPTARRANKMFEKQETSLDKNLGGYYGDELADDYEKAERAVRFGAANTGNIGGSVYADARSDLQLERGKGATQIDEAVRRAITGLKADREDARLRSIGLVNAGAGTEGVTAAQQGIRGAIQGAKSANREVLFTDLFDDLAFTKATSDANSRDAALLEYFRRGKSNSLGAGAAPSGGATVRY